MVNYLVGFSFKNIFLIGFQNHFTIKAKAAEKKATINGQIVLNKTPPVLGSIYASTLVLNKILDVNIIKIFKDIFLVNISNLNYYLV